MTDFAVDPSPDTAPAAHGSLAPHDRPTIPVTPDTPGALTEAQRSLGYIAADWTRRGPYGHWLPPGGVMDYDPRQLFRLDPAFLARYEGKVPGWLPLGRVVFERTYARFLHHLGRPETPPEVFARCCEAVFGVYAHQATVADAHWSADKAQREAQEMFRRMWGCSDDPDDVGAAWAFALPGADGPVARTARFLPAGRGLANLGTVAMLAKGGMCLNSCGFVSTEAIGSKCPALSTATIGSGPAAFSRPFTFLMDALMLGVGVGFDTDGAGKAVLVAPERRGTFTVEDTREGWVAAVGTLLRAYVGDGALPEVWDVSRIRAKGQPLRTFGGTSSGPGPLLALLSSLEALCDRYAGRAVDSVWIVDTANMIGRCVVAGGVRRSSELALGSADDFAFLDLKNPAALKADTDAQARVRATNPEAVALDTEIAEAREAQGKHSPLDPVWAVWQDTIDAAEGRMYGVLSADPEWSAAEARINAHPLRTHRWSSNNSTRNKVGQDYTDIGARNAQNGEPGGVWPDNMNNYGRMVDGDLSVPRGTRGEGMASLRVDKARGPNPCGEQPLESTELCNLIETFPTNHRTTADWHATLKHAYLMGKAISCIPTHDAETDAIVRRNRRIGISVAGVAEWHERVGMRAMCEAMDHGYRELRRIDALYSGWLAMPESVRLTTVKPGGSIPLVVGVEGGMRFPEAPYYVRTVRLHDTSPLIDRLAAAGHRIEPDRYAPNTVVAYFPMRDTRVGRYSRDVSLWEQAGLQAALQRWWSDNMVSATWMFQPHEARDIPAVLGAFDHALKGFSALPYSGHAYAQAPYIPCTEAEYHALACKLRPVDFSGLGFSRVDHESAAEKFCTGAACELPVKASDPADAPAA